LNPQNFAATSPDLSFNAAVGFAMNANCQVYSGESTLSDLVHRPAAVGNS
jgi:K+-transporting ATPase A subunit